MVLETTKNGS